ncbi:MAG: RimK family alpha-L-glutamate ligase [Planctomycetes bacterium]|nr:RimK family alpha-L-glutamate ligase [Planctomycetota bacterium]
MHIGVLSSPNSWYFNDLLRAADGRHQIAACSFGQLSTFLSPEVLGFQSGDQNLADFDAVLVRTMPPGSLEQVVFRMDILARLEVSGCLVVNPPRAIETAVDKYLALARLRAADLDIPDTCVCQTVDDAMIGFEKLGGDVVIKPLFGSEGRGIMRVSNVDLALRAFKMLEQLGAVIYLQRFIEHEGFDYRLLVIGERVLGIRRRNNTDWRTNVSRGAVAEPLELDEHLVSIARTAATAVSAPLAGVDVLPSRDGRCLVLEVNAVPGWKSLSTTLDTDVADLVLRYLEDSFASL